MIAAMMFRQFVYTREISLAADQHRYDAAHDALTGLANRKAFFDRLGEHLCTPGSGTAAVLLFDLDGFKEVNDTYGHDVGDGVLVSFADSLREGAPDDLVARLGGDEFAILVTGPDVELRAVTLGNALATRRRRASDRGGPLAVACSIGIALSRDGDVSEALLRRADLAMYTAKRSPMSRLACFSEEMAAVADRSHLLAAALRRATARGEMSLVYQPLYRLGDGELAGAEALLRWTHPHFGPVSPDEFIPLAEDTGAISQIGLWVLEQSVAQMARWQQQGRPRAALAVRQRRPRRAVHRRPPGGGGPCAGQPRAAASAIDLGDHREPAPRPGGQPADAAPARVSGYRSPSTTSGPATRRSPSSPGCPSTSSRSTATSSSTSGWRRGDRCSTPSSAWPRLWVWPRSPRASRVSAERPATRASTSGRATSSAGRWPPRRWRGVGIDTVLAPSRSPRLAPYPPVSEPR